VKGTESAESMLGVLAWGERASLTP